MRRLENYVKKYGPEFGPVYFHMLQSQAAHAQVSSRLRRKLDVLTGKTSASQKSDTAPLPLFPDSGRERDQESFQRDRQQQEVGSGS